jgi:hypothetical protein
LPLFYVPLPYLQKSISGSLDVHYDVMLSLSIPPEATPRLADHHHAARLRLLTYQSPFDKLRVTTSSSAATYFVRTWLSQFSITMRLRSLIYALLLLLSAPLLHAGVPGDSVAQRRKLDAIIARYATRTEELLDPKVRAVLRHIPNRERRILATNHYLRRRHLVETRWAMTATEVKAYKKSAEYRVMMAEVESVKRSFAELNPDYRLTAVTEVRTLGTQLAGWNRVQSVRLAAQELLDTCRAILSDSTTLTLTDEEAYNRFFALFSTYETELLTTVAVPGFSLHGRLRAFDFKILKGRKTIAGTSTRTIAEEWDKPGWTQKLKEAVAATSSRFMGPLAEPYEPWHYEYVP